MVFGRRTTVLLTGTLVERRGAGDHRSGAALLGGHRASLVVGADVCGGDSRPSGVSQCAHRVEAARDRVVVRLAARIKRRHGDPANSWKDGRRLGLPGFLSAARRSRRWRFRSSGWRGASVCRRIGYWRNGRRCEACSSAPLLLGACFEDHLANWCSSTLRDGLRATGHEASELVTPRDAALLQRVCRAATVPASVRSSR